MAKKVYELATEIGVGALDLVEKLKTMGFNIRNHMASLTDEEVLKAKAAYEAPSKSSSSIKKAVVRKVVKKDGPTVAPVSEVPVVHKDVAPSVAEQATVVVQAPPVAGNAPVS